GWFASVILLMGTLLLTGCAAPSADPGEPLPRTEDMSFDQFGQTDFNRTVTIAMRDNLSSLNRLLEKLYRRNPAEWRKTGAPDIETAIQRGRQAIESGKTPPELASLRDIEI